MFSTQNITNATPQQMALQCFETLRHSSQLSYQSGCILDVGITLLKNSTHLTKNELDKIIVGTLLLTLARDDFKYGADHLNADITRQIFSIVKCPPYSHNFFNENYNKQDILSLGKTVLEEKTIAFNGTFSLVANIQAMIENNMPFIDNRYFEEYGIKHAVTGMKLSELNN